MFTGRGVVRQLQRRFRLHERDVRAEAPRRRRQRRQRRVERRDGHLAGNRPLNTQLAVARPRHLDPQLRHHSMVFLFSRSPFFVGTTWLLLFLLLP